MRRAIKQSHGLRRQGGVSWRVMAMRAVGLRVIGLRGFELRVFGLRVLALGLFLTVGIWLSQLAPMAFAQTPEADASSLVTPRQVEGRWDGFVATSSNEHLYKLVRVSLEISSDANLSVSQNAAKRQTLSAAFVAGYDLIGDEAIRAFHQPLKIKLAIAEVPMGYVHPGFETTYQGGQLASQLNNAQRRLRGSATIPATLNTQTGQVDFGPGWIWDQKPSIQVFKPDQLRLILDLKQQVIFGELGGQDAAYAIRRWGVSERKASLPACFWRQGQVPQQVMDQLGEALVMSAVIPNYSWTRASQKAAVELELKLQQESQQGSQRGSQQGSQTLPGDARRGARGGDSNARDTQADRSVQTLSTDANESDELTQARQELELLEAELADLQAQMDELKEAKAQADIQVKAIRQVRRELTGAERDEANQKFQQAQAESNRLRQAQSDASKVHRAKKKQVDAAAQRVRILIKEQKKIKDNEEKDQWRALVKRPEPDVQMDTDQILTWVEKLHTSAPGLMDEKNGAMLSHWPNVAQNLFADDALIEAFGQPLTEWSIADRWVVGQAIKRTKYIRSNTDGVPVLPDVFPEPFVRYFEPQLDKHFPRTLARYYMHQHMRRYLSDLDEVIAGQPVDQLTFLRLAYWQELSDTYVAQLWPQEKQDIDGLIQLTKTDQADAVLAARVKAAIQTSGDRRYPASYLSSWWFNQIEFQLHATQSGKNASLAQLHLAIDSALERQLSPLIDQIDQLGEGLQAVLAGGRLYRQAEPIVGRASDRPMYQAFEKRLKQRRVNHFKQAEGDIRARLAAFNDFGAIDTFVGQVLVLPQDRRSVGGKTLLAMADERRNQIDLERFLARFSERERSLMIEPGRLQVPEAFSAPTSQEIKFAYYREVGQPNPDGSDSVLMYHPFEEIMNQLGGGILHHDYVFKMKDVEILAKLELRGAYWVIYEFNQTLTPRGWAYDQMRQGPYSMLGPLLDELTEEMPMYVVDRFELTESGWRSSTVRKHFARGLTLREFRRGPMLWSDVRKAIANDETVNGEDRDNFAQQLGYLARSYGYDY